MAITEKDVAAQAGDMARRITEAERSRPAGLELALQAQQAKADALQAERIRLLHRYGAADPRVLRMTARIEAAREQHQHFSAERQRSSISGPRPDQGTAALHGRIVDAQELGVPGVTVRARLRDDAKKLAKAVTDDAGHFALALKPLRAEDAELPVVLEVLAGNNRITYRDTESRMLPVGSVAYTEISIADRTPKAPASPEPAAPPPRASGPPRPGRARSAAEKKR